MSVSTVTDRSYRWSSADVADRFSFEVPATGEVIAVIQGGGAAEVDGPSRRPTGHLPATGAGDPQTSEPGCSWPARRSRGGLARRIDVGIVLVNNYFRGLLGLPFGGTKHSGHAREHTIETLSHFGYRKLIRIPSGIGTWPSWRAVTEIFD
jgi:Aldehyde dehydrogenase family